jgi:sialic acid synthase SpsE/sugar phosphate isomerase/epimerase
MSTNINILDRNSVFIIAEIGNNHNGDIIRAKNMIDLVCEMGADCAKFQMRHLDFVYRQKSLDKTGEDLGTEYIIDLLNRFELSIEEHRELSKYCEKKGILYLCTPWDPKSVDVLEEFKVSAYKVASADLTNFPLIEKLIKTKKTLILSTGMSTIDEIKSTTNLLNRHNAKYAILHCNSTYPAPFQDINLQWMNNLKKIHPIIGYSGHERGTSVSIAAVALGARIIERHFTIDRNMEGPDHAASLEYNEFKSLIKGIREVEQALGSDGAQRIMSQGEMMNKENLGKSLVASMDLEKGTIIVPEHIKVLSPGQGLSPHYYSELIGKQLKRDMKIEDYFFTSDIEDKRAKPRDFKFNRPWGIPIRYHDFNKFYNLIKPDLFEFHLSYSDMELEPSIFLKEKYDIGFVVHAPELFKGSHLMDLATSDEEYRAQSLIETQSVIDITRSLKKYFPNEKCPLIVANIGGVSMDAPILESVKTELYETFFQSLNLLNKDGVEIIPQTMAPFPWHFGGQRYQNIFVLPEEIAFYCKKFGLRICFDVSHSMLTCNHFGIDFYEFAKIVAPYTAHLHLGDAKGVNGEGLQIGEGEIDFKKLYSILNEYCPKSSFIPEIWQGHKNDGEGFWFALEKLEGKI